MRLSREANGSSKYCHNNPLCKTNQHIYLSLFSCISVFTQGFVLWLRPLDDLSRLIVTSDFGAPTPLDASQAWHGLNLIAFAWHVVAHQKHLAILGRTCRKA